MLDPFLAELLVWVFVIGGAILFSLSIWIAYQRPCKPEELPKYKSEQVVKNYYKEQKKLPKAEAIVYGQMLDLPQKRKLEID